MFCVKGGNKQGDDKLMSICKYCNQEIEWQESKRTGEPYTVNIDGLLHQCPNYNKSKNNNSSSNIETNIEYLKAKVTTAGELLDEKNIENARWFIDGLNQRLVQKRIELIVKERDGSS